MPTYQHNQKLPNLTTATPGVVLFGVTSDDQIIPVGATDTGALMSTLSVDNVDIGMVDQGTPAGVTNAWPVIAVGSSNSFYSDQSVTGLTSTYTQFPFGFSSVNMTLANDSTSTNDITFSFNGTDTHGVIKAGEIFSFDYRRQSSIWMLGDSSASYRLMVY